MYVWTRTKQLLLMNIGKVGDRLRTILQVVSDAGHMIPLLLVPTDDGGLLGVAVVFLIDGNPLG